MGETTTNVTNERGAAYTKKEVFIVFFYSDKASEKIYINKTKCIWKLLNFPKISEKTIKNFISTTQNKSNVCL